jgi:hypothetical protein
MQEENLTTTVCLDRDTLAPPQLAKLFEPEILSFRPDYLRTDDFLKGGGAYRPPHHQSMVADSKKISSMSIEARQNEFAGNALYVTYLQSYGLQTISWDLHRDLAPPQGYLSNLQGLAGFNAAYSVSTEDSRWQSTRFLNSFEAYGKSTDGFTLKVDENHDQLVVDISKNPGQRHPIPYMWLQSCWRMWFSGKAFSYMPKERLLSFPEGRRIEELPSGVVFIELYEDPFAAEDPENRRIQQAFRDWVDMDRIQETAHLIFPHAADPTYSMERGEFEHGGVCLLIRWVDKRGKPVPRSQAVKKQMQELDEDGQLVWSGSEPVTPAS